MPVPVETSLEALVARARRLAAAPERRLLGVTGPPGAGKSTLAEHVVRALGPDRARLVPMDGFHLAGEELIRLGRARRKGAPDTFDAGGYVALLHRLRDPAEEVVYAPAFCRELEEPVAGALPVDRAVPLVVTEGNYLLVADGPWAGVRPLLHEVWYVELDEAVRIDRLVARHRAYGKSAADAVAWARGSDQRNTDVVAATRARADLVVRVEPGYR